MACFVRILSVPSLALLHRLVRGCRVNGKIRLKDKVDVLFKTKCLTMYSIIKVSITIPFQ